MSISMFTSESVCAGHPDKICDQISDAILDAVLAQDPFGRVAVEAMVTKNNLILTGEISTTAMVDYEAIARSQIHALGYHSPEQHFHHNCNITNLVHQQSSEIAVGVDTDGAGDQGMMFGYACNQTPEFMPLPIALTHALAKKIDEVREDKILDYLRPDGKTQATITYENGQPKKVASLVIAVPHRPDIAKELLEADLRAKVITPVLNYYSLNASDYKLVINGTGIWHNGGPASDAGLTGRKIVVDTYGGYARVGGGAFSGKDPSKVDRSGAYAARYIAKNIVAHGLADQAEVRLAYVIGQPKPLMHQIETFGTQTVSNYALQDFSNALLDTSVKGIIEGLDLRKPIYKNTAAYGHFGRHGFSWEELSIG